MSKTQSCHRFVGKTALVTGAAMGVGAATAERLAGEGARVLLVDVDVERGQATAGALPGSGHRFIEGDLSRRESAEEIAEQARQITDAVHVLINNAGIYIETSLENLSDESYERLMTINLHSHLRLTNALLPLMRDNAAAIVNISSEAAWRPRKLGIAYDVSKAAIGGLTRSLAAELWQYRIRVNEIAPGGIVTEMHFLTAEDPMAAKRELEEWEMPEELSVMRRMAHPSELAAAIAFLASEDASFITAATLHVNGGQSIG